MDAKMINLAIGKLSDDVEKLQEQIKEILIRLSALQLKRDQVEIQTQPTPVDNEFITLEEVRKILKMSRNSILQMIDNGLINPIRLTKRTIRYLKSEILSVHNQTLKT